MKTSHITTSLNFARRFSRVFAASAVASAMGTASLSSQTIDTWDGGGIDNNWSTGDNWVDNTAPVSGDIQLNFENGPGIATALTNDIGALDVRKIEFNNTGAWQLNGSALNLGATVAQGNEIRVANPVSAVIVANDINENAAVGSKQLDMQIINADLTFTGTVSGSSARDIVITDGGGTNATFRIDGSLTTQGDVILSSANATFDLNDPGSMTAYIGASGTNNSIGGSGTALMDGTLIFDLTNASTGIGDSWTIVSIIEHSRTARKLW